MFVDCYEISLGGGGVTDMIHTSRCGCSTAIIHAGRIWGLTSLWIMELSGFLDTLVFRWDGTLGMTSMYVY